MAKKLNLVLREPVRLYDPPASFGTGAAQPFEKLKTSEDRNRSEKLVEQENSEQKRKANQIIAEKSNVGRKTSEKLPKNQSKREELAKTSESVVDLRTQMSPRVRQIWEFLRGLAKRDSPQNSFNVTRAEVMRETGVGSTNTYREALRKFRELGLIEVELRPGVNAGSVFHLTKKGLEQVELD